MARIAEIEVAVAAKATLLDRHSDAAHDRTVLTLAGRPAALVEALAAAAGRAVAAIDWLDPAERDAARTAAIAVAELIGALGVPVFLYGELASGADRVERAYFRNGGLAELWLRMEGGELAPDRGPAVPHRSAGATLVTARPPLAAFNVELDSGDPEVARAVAAGLRESGGGLAGVRAIGLPLASDRTQVSTNVHDPLAVPLVAVVERIRALAEPLGARPVEAELVGLVPQAALRDYPEDAPIRGFDPDRQTIERRLSLAP
jgi:glutamate formiminotransferase